MAINNIQLGRFFDNFGKLVKLEASFAPLNRSLNLTSENTPLARGMFLAAKNLGLSSKITPQNLQEFTTKVQISKIVFSAIERISPEFSLIEDNFRLMLGIKKDEKREEIKKSLEEIFKIGRRAIPTETIDSLKLFFKTFSLLLDPSDFREISLTAESLLRISKTLLKTGRLKEAQIILPQTVEVVRRDEAKGTMLYRRIEAAELLVDAQMSKEAKKLLKESLLLSSRVTDMSHSLESQREIAVILFRMGGRKAAKEALRYFVNTCSAIQSGLLSMIGASIELYKAGWRKGVVYLLTEIGQGEFNPEDLMGREPIPLLQSQKTSIVETGLEERLRFRRIQALTEVFSKLSQTAFKAGKRKEAREFARAGIQLSYHLEKYIATNPLTEGYSKSLALSELVAALVLLGEIKATQRIIENMEHPTLKAEAEFERIEGLIEAKREKEAREFLSNINLQNVHAELLPRFYIRKVALLIKLGEIEAAQKLIRDHELEDSGVQKLLEAGRIEEAIALAKGLTGEKRYWAETEIAQALFKKGENLRGLTALDQAKAALVEAKAAERRALVKPVSKKKAPPLPEGPAGDLIQIVQAMDRVAPLKIEQMVNNKRMFLVEYASQAGEIEWAKEMLKEIELNYYYLEAQKHLIEALLAANRLEEAQSELDRVSIEDPNNFKRISEAYFAIAKALAAQGKRPAALQILERALALGNKMSKSLFTRAEIFYQALETLVEIDPLLLSHSKFLDWLKKLDLEGLPCL